MMPRRFYIKTYGCQMNELDSEVIAGELIEHGFEQTEREADADILVVNTCSVRDLAERKAMGKIGLLSRRKQRNGTPIIAVVGCMAQAKQATLFRKLPGVDVVCGPGRINHLPLLVEEAAVTRARLIDVDGNRAQMVSYRAARRGDPVKAYVAIMRGCDHYCSYCIVPYVRGREVSRPPAEILDEIWRLADDGYKDVTLLGQNVNSYGRGLDEGIDFPRLLDRVNAVEGLERIRFVTSHPKDISPALIERLRDLPKVCEYLHFPLQSGSDRILRLMNRGYTAADYLRLVDRLRETVPDIALSTDIIVGFPTETEPDFEETVACLRRIAYDSAFLFKYSPRRGTAATAMPDDVPQAVKEARHRRVLDLQNEISLAKYRARIGRVEEVLVEGPSKTERRRLTGRTRQNKIVVFDGASSLVGRLLRLTITGATAHTLFGEPVAPASAGT